MGAWGHGVYENDHAADLLGIHVDDLGDSLENALNEKNPSWTDIEGPLIYVHMLGLLAKHPDIEVDLDGSKVEEWKRRYLAIYDSSLARTGVRTEGTPRRAVIVKTFDALLACVDDDDDDDEPTRKPAAKKPAARKPAARKPAARKPAAKKPAAKKPTKR